MHLFAVCCTERSLREMRKEREGKQENVIMCPACPIALSSTFALFLPLALSQFLFWMKWRKIPLLICELRLTDVRWWKARCMKTVNENLPLWCGCGFLPPHLHYFMERQRNRKIIFRFKVIMYLFNKNLNIKLYESICNCIVFYPKNISQKVKRKHTV